MNPSDLAALSTEELKNRTWELGQFVQSCNTAIVRAREDMNQYKGELTRRDVFECAVSDHAIVRYLERVTDVDLDLLRAEIRGLARDAVAFAKCDGHWHAEKRLVFILNETGDVVTVLSEEQAARYWGRRLVNGTRAEPRLDPIAKEVSPADAVSSAGHKTEVGE